MTRSMSAELLPLMLMMGRHGGRTVRGLHLPPEGFLRDMAPYLPETAQPRVLQAASILQAGREMRRCCEFAPPAQPRNADPLDMMQTLGRYLPADGPGQGMLRQLGRMRQFRQMFRFLGSQSLFGTSSASSSALGSQGVFGASSASSSALGSQGVFGASTASNSALGSQGVFGTSTASSSALGSQGFFGASAPGGSALGSQGVFGASAPGGSALGSQGVFGASSPGGSAPPDVPEAPSPGPDAAPGGPPPAFPALSPEMLGTLLRLSRNLSASAPSGSGEADGLT